MGVPGGFRQAIAGATTHDISDGRFQADAVAGRHVERLDTGSGAQHRPDDLVIHPQRRPCSTLIGHVTMVTVQPSLGHAHRGNIHQQAEMTGDPQATRMGDALPVAQQQIRRLMHTIMALPSMACTRSS